MYHKKLTKLEIAEAQLSHAVELYLTGSNLISAITLAGAAEEILGKLVKKKSAANALEEKIEKLCRMFMAVFKEPSDPKEFVALQNKARDAFKHIKDGNSVELNLENEAVKLLNRAIKNYKKLNLGHHRYPLFRGFEKERSRRRKLQQELVKQ